MTAVTGGEVPAGGPRTADVFAGPGEMRALCRALDWAATPLGPVEAWAPALRTAVGVCLDSALPTCVHAGPELALVYNDRWRPWLGTAKHPGALGRPAREVWAEVWAALAPEFARVMGGGPPVSRENERFVIERGSGPEETFFTYALSPVRDAAGAVVAVHNVCIETTGRVRAERALAALMAASPAVMAVYSGPEHVVTYVNPTWERVVGKPEAIGRPFREVFPEMADTGLFERLAHVYETGEPYSVAEMRLPLRRRADGPVEESFWDFLWQPQSGAAGDGPSGHGAEILLHAVEVTAHVRARREVERLLAESERTAAALAGREAEYRTLFASMDEGFLLAEVLFDDAGEAVDLLYLEANPAATRVTRVDYTGRRLRELDPDYEPYWLEICARVARTGVGERHVRHAAPLDPWVDFNVFPVGEAGGRRVAVLFRDVTARRRQEAHAAFLASVQDDLSHVGSTDEILQAVGARLGAYLDLATCSFIDVDESAAEQLTVSHTWTAEGAPSLLGRFRIEDYLQPEFARACRAGETVVVRDTYADPRTDGDSYARHRIGAFVVVPFHRDGAWKFHLGVSVAAPRDWRDDEVALIEEILGRTVPRLERARAEAALRASEARQAFLLALQDRLLPLDDPDEIQFEAARALGELLRASRVGYAEIEADGEHSRVTRNYTDGVRGIEGRYRVADYSPALIEALHAGRTVARDDIARDPTLTDAERAAHAALTLAATVNVPLIRGGRLVAALFAHFREPHAWTAEELTLLSDVAARTWDAVERARAESALKAGEASLRLALDVAELGTWTWDLVTGAGSLDARGAEIVGLPGRTLADVAAAQFATIHPDDLARTQADAAAGIASGEPFDLEYRVVLASGRVRHVASRARTLTDGAGRPTRLVGTNRDVTAEREAAKERERLLADAEAARDAAEAASRAKGEFLAVMSHELRTPLNAIGGYAELMELGIHGPVTAEQRTALDRIQRSQRALLSVINEVLNYARLETGAVTYDLTDVPVAEAVGTAEVLVAPQLRAKRLGYSWAGCDPGLTVRADRDKLQQVLLNLLSNAIKFTEARDGQPGRLEVTCATDPADADRVVLRVRDTGIGIAADKLGAVFEPFVQVDQRLTREHSGTGLGLAISRDLARGMGGDLTVESTPGVGSTFTLTLPRA